MSEITDIDALRQALAENAGQPEGPARNARAEELLAEAERLDVPLAVIEALGHQLKVCNHSSEKDKMFVPFARLLRMWDERPEDFDEHETHSLHWAFKWMSAGMLDQPHIPLASIEKWLGEMERRYRLAGHSERAVRGAEFGVAAHIGDIPRARRAYAAWLAADRDRMADCPACELHAQGVWQVRCGRDAEALRLWRPVLEGEFACAHEPHSVLASSLAPLLRLGRVDEARAHHLRGFRLVRPMESMRGAYADHVEFCALSGNEARGLELLAGRPAYFTDSGHPRSRLDFLTVVALLMDRLTERGLGGQRVPGPAGRSWTARELAAHARVEATELAARFDRRNGTFAVGDRVRARMDQRPLVDRLPLGVRTVRPAVAPPAAAPVPEATEEPSLPALLAEARRQSGTLRPHALRAWAAVARAARDTELEPRDRAEIADHEAMARGAEGLPLFERAARLYAEAGDPGEALAARARAAYVRALAGEVEPALTTVARLYDEVLALYADEGTGVRQTASVAMSRARVLMRRVHAAAEGGTGGLDLGDAGGAWGDGGAEGFREAEAAGTAEDAEGNTGGPALGAVETGADGGQKAAGARGPGADGRQKAASARTPGTDGGQDTADARTPGTDHGQEAAEAWMPGDGAEDGAGPWTGGADGRGAGAGAGVRRPRTGLARAVAGAEAAVREVLALVEGHDDGDVRLAARAAEARGMLAELAGMTGDARRAAELFRRSADEYVAAGLPWFAVEYEVQVAALAHQAGDLTGAERALRAALEHGGPYVEPVGRAQLHLQLAEVLGALDAPAEAAGHALESAHWADEAGEGATLGAWARQQLGGFLLRRGRYAEAAEVLRSALADLSPGTHGDEAVVQARWWLGDCLGELGEHRAAAEEWLGAAGLARHWPDQQDHATLAHLAAESLGNAGLAAEADRAYARAGELWRALGNAPFLVRSLRARAWLALGGEAGAAPARALMTEAVRECGTALAAARGADRTELATELGGTYRQFAELLARSASEEAEDAAIRAAFEAALEQMNRAVAVFTTLGTAGLHGRTGAELGAGWLEADLGRPERAEARARAVLAVYEGADDGDETVRERRAEAAQMLQAAREGQEGQEGQAGRQGPVTD
ncbi:tetratricopeptide repeat protein [Streptomyces sp. CSDS2]|uniref:tetratricopeptide repeat protein n=1 Tax=Streptomyces sp. CSDS2 TaxID=3055051 RepID=UPI0025B1BDC3|nr:tetratricopeptide repeat protein [Streptomyces sp. CSDS2]MDN3264418.1 tetratricopeptide repeat protein [Streptomyces sp. CSDS2]